MSYRVEFGGAALTQLHGLPPTTFGAMVDCIVELVEAPWDAVLMDAGGDPAFRQVIFGQGLGLLSFHVNDQAELITIFDVAWIG